MLFRGEFSPIDGGVMHTGRLVFSQVMDLLPLADFRRCVARYPERRSCRTFTCLDQFLCMAFAQLSGRESLRDIEPCLRAVLPSSTISEFVAMFVEPRWQRPTSDVIGASSPISLRC